MNYKIFRGIAIELNESISGCPPLNDDLLPAGSALLQNLPSILCVMALNPKPGDCVLDMCASPGNKTTHIAELMKNEVIIMNNQSVITDFFILFLGHTDSTG